MSAATDVKSAAAPVGGTKWNVTTPGGLGGQSGKVNGETGKSQFYSPKRACAYVDPTQNNETVYLITEMTTKIRCFNPKTKLVSDWADVGPAIEKTGMDESEPFAIVADPVRSKSVYFSDRSDRIWRFADGIVTLIASGKKLSPPLEAVSSLLVRRDGSELFVACRGNNMIACIDLLKPPAGSGESYPTKVVCGAATGTKKSVDHESNPLEARFSMPLTLQWVYPADESKGVWIGEHDALRLWNIATGAVSTLKGATVADRISRTPSGHLIGASYANVCAIPAADGGAKDGVKAIPLVSGAYGFADGDALTEAKFSDITELVVSATEKCVYVIDSQNHTLRRLELPESYFTVPPAAPVVVDSKSKA